MSRSGVASVAVTYPSPARAWSAIGIFAVLALLSGTDRQVLNLLVDPIKQSFAVGDITVSLLQGGGFALVYGLLGLPMGWLVDRRNRRNLIVAGIVVWSVATAWCGLAQTIAAMFAARALVAVGETVLAPAVFSLIADLFPPHRRGTALAIYFAGSNASDGLSVMSSGILLDFFAPGHAASALLHGLLPWRAILVFLSFPGLLLALLTLFIAEPPRLDPGYLLADTGRERLHRLTRYIVAHRLTLALIGVPIVLAITSDYGVNSWLPTLMMRRYHVSPATAGTQIGAVGFVISIVGTLAGGFLADVLYSHGAILGRAKLQAAALTLTIPFLFFPLAGTPAAMLTVYGIYALVLTAGLIAGVAALQDIFPRDMLGLLGSIRSFIFIVVGLGFGPTLVASVTTLVFRDTDAVGYSILVVELPCFIVGATLSWFALTPYRRTRESLLAAGESP